MQHIFFQTKEHKSTVYLALFLSAANKKHLDQATAVTMWQAKSLYSTCMFCYNILMWLCFLVIPSLLVTLSSPISALRKSAVSCLKSIGKLCSGVQPSPITALVSVLLDSAEELSADPAHLQRYVMKLFHECLKIRMLLSFICPCFGVIDGAFSKCDTIP